MRTRIAGLALVTLVLAACGSGGGNEGAPASPSLPSSPAAERPSSTAGLAIVQPKTGTVVEGSTVLLQVSLEGAKLVPQTTTDITPDEGHLHVLLDDQLVSMTEGLEQEIADVAPGTHRITVEFVASDHFPFDPRVVSVVAFEVLA
ncbi:MAG: DUF6130 family protein [Actinobacteria bacterium]|nr:DUF6130 family protein [Actinomycetota bacterium]